MRFLILLPLFFWGWLFQGVEEKVVFMPEICDNGIDDDGDGLIDLNDTTDCFCNGIRDVIFSPSSLIPNPSFEDTLCCPQGLAQLNCAADWIQASSATSDYFHTCGYPFNDERGRPPQPLPAGEGYVGFLDIQGIFGLTYKEYVGACLNAPMETGTEYTLQFYLGFGRQGTIYNARSPVNIVLYGTTDCDELPFGGRNFQDCPSVLPEWFEVANVVLTGSNEWVKATMTFTPSVDIAAVAVGTGCARATGGHYYFLDDLVLNESRKFNTVPLVIEGEECDPFITLRSDTVNGLGYQWYRNGIAIDGQTEPELTIPRADTGEYILRVDNGVDCQLTNAFQHYPLDYTATIDTTICQGSRIILENQLITGDFLDTFVYPSTQYCDSSIIVRVRTADTTTAVIDTSICPNDAIVVAGNLYQNEGQYRIVTFNDAGCDSIIYLNLTWADTIFSRLDTSLCIGSIIEINGEFYDRAGAYVQNISDSAGCQFQLALNIAQRDTFRTIIDTQLCQGERLFPGGPVVNSSSDFTYNLTSSIGCDSTVIYRATVLNNYTVDLDTFYCEGSSITLFNEVIDSSGLYQFDLQSSEGCDSIIRYNVRERAMYLATLDTAICEGSTIVVLGETISAPGSYQLTTGTGTCDTMIDLTVSLLERFSVGWDTTLCFGETISWEGETFNSSGEYEKVLQAGNGCDSTVTLSLRILDEPRTQKVMIQPVLCHGDSNAIVRIEGNTNIVEVIWADGSTGRLRSGLPSGIYPYEVIFEAECTKMDTLVLEEPEPLYLEWTAVDIPCQMEGVGQIILDSLVGGTGPITVFLDGERQDLSSSMMIEDLEEGRYLLRVEDENGCFIQESVSIFAQAEGDVSVDVSASEVTLGDSVVFTIFTQGIDSLTYIEWTGPADQCLSDCERWVVYPEEGTSEYNLYAEDNNGCVYELSFVITAERKIFAPNTFTPNGDFLNDVFTIYDNGAVDVIEKMEIYDRWGELVYRGVGLEPGQPDQGWDGQFNGRLQPPGVYVYYVEVRDNSGEITILSGDVTMIY
jgi:gliding motility-associated-like protein